MLIDLDREERDLILRALDLRADRHAVQAERFDANGLPGLPNPSADIQRDRAARYRRLADRIREHAADG